MTDDTRNPDVRDDARERELDDLLRLAARAAFERLERADPRDAEFFDWYAREMRVRRTLEERRADAEAAAAFGARVAARWASGEARVVDVEGRPTLHSIPATPVAGVFGIAPARIAAPQVDLAIAAGVGRELWDEECTEWAEIPPGVPAGKHLALRVAGDSMTPFLHAGDTVLVRLGDAIVGGSIIVARRPDDGYVVKRVGRVNGVDVELESLNPQYPPISIPRDGRLVLGTVVLRWCDHGGGRVG